MDTKAVTNSQFRKFARDTKFKTDAEKYAWSFVLDMFVDARVKKTITETPQVRPRRGEGGQKEAEEEEKKEGIIRK